MAKVTKFHGDGTITVTDLPEPNYHAKRGKVPPPAKAAWDAKDGHGKPLDTDQGRKILDDALGD